MTQEGKMLLLKDLCARLPYGVKFLRESWNYEWDQETSVIEVLEDIDKDGYINNTKVYTIEDIKPYLRSLSSMTEEEKHKLLKFGAITCLKNGEVIDVSCVGFGRHADVQDYLNTCHFDYRGLIKKGIAIEAPKGMYNIKKKYL